MTDPQPEQSHTPDIHTAEPWVAEKATDIDPRWKYKLGRVMSSGRKIGALMRYEDAVRLVACVNACKGIPTERLEHSTGWILPMLRRAKNVHAQKT